MDQNFEGKIITIDEFFRYKDMLEGLPDDRNIALEILKKSNYKNKDIINTLLAKSLMFTKRAEFCEGVMFKFDSKKCSYQDIYAFIKREKADKIYMDIFKKMRDE